MRVRLDEGGEEPVLTTLTPAQGADGDRVDLGVGEHLTQADGQHRVRADLDEHPVPVVER